VSVNVGEPREVRWRGKPVLTAIFKEPVEGRVPVRRLNLDGDLQADLRAHGGLDKAVYAYPAEHYAFWQAELGRELPWGQFGENLTVEGLPLEGAVAIGDRYRVGTAELVVTQPRLPCFKLGIRFGDQHMVKRFLAAGRTGFYLRVEREGEVAAGDEVVLLERDPAGVPVAEVTRLYAHDRDDVDAVRRVLEAEALPDGWRDWFLRLLEPAA
jgi:MOSC domain-containing protein YiiM